MRDTSREESPVIRSYHPRLWLWLCVASAEQGSSFQIEENSDPDWAIFRRQIGRIIGVCESLDPSTATYKWPPHQSLFQSSGTAVQSHHVRSTTFFYLLFKSFYSKGFTQNHCAPSSSSSTSLYARKLATSREYRNETCAR